MNTELVRRLKLKIVCDTYTCNNMADYEIGHGLMPALALHVCKECMQTIFKDTRMLMQEDFKKENSSQTNIATDNNVSLTEEITDSVDDNEKNFDGEYYECKKCGTKFKKPSEISVYRSHLRKCGAKSC